jgi:hypothetical protein
MGNEPIGVSSGTVLPDTTCRSASPVSLEAKPNWTTTKRSTGGAKIEEVLTDLKKKFPEGGNADA